MRPPPYQAQLNVCHLPRAAAYTATALSDSSSARFIKDATHATRRKRRRILSRREPPQQNNIQNPTGPIRRMDLSKATQPHTRRRAAGNTSSEYEAHGGNDDDHGYGDGLVLCIVIDVEQDTARPDVDGVGDGVAPRPAEHHGRQHLVRALDLLEGGIAVGEVDGAQRAVGVLLLKAETFAIYLRVCRFARQAGDSRRARWFAWVRLHGFGQEWWYEEGDESQEAK